MVNMKVTKFTGAFRAVVVFLVNDLTSRFFIGLIISYNMSAAVGRQKDKRKLNPHVCPHT
jgi:hypothetical protein